jgi:hypothetical protein
LSASASASADSASLNDASPRALQPAQQRGSIARKLAATLRGDLDTIALKALKKSPLERYPTVNAFAEDIVRYHSGEPVTARPDGVFGGEAAFWYAQTLVAKGQSSLGTPATVACNAAPQGVNLADPSGIAAARTSRACGKNHRQNS